MAAGEKRSALASNQWLMAYGGGENGAGVSESWRNAAAAIWHGWQQLALAAAHHGVAAGNGGAHGGAAASSRGVALLL